MFFVIALCAAFTGGAFAVTPRQAANAANANNPNAAYNYSYMYPYLNNQMKTDLNPGGVTPGMGSNPINAVVRTIPDNSSQRSVVPRTRKTSAARAASNTATAAATSAARSATNAARAATNAATSASAVRSATPQATATTSSGNANGRRVVARSTRGELSYVNRAATNATANTNIVGTAVSSSRCLADYTDCMNGYCQRDNTAYNRCYCSSRLSQIEAQYQPAIDKLIQQILMLKNNNYWSQEEMNQYWMETIGQYTGGNTWQDLDSALDIDWAGTESRVRGQQAFATGHSYCVQHLKNCAAMASNLRDAYRSEISRDCDAYEASLQRIKNVAESIVENYSD